MESISQILKRISDNDSGKYLSQEWQLFAYKLANGLDDTKRMSMYMKLAKTTKREILQKAWDFVKESNPRSKSRLFLWKVGQLKKEMVE